MAGETADRLAEFPRPLSNMSCLIFVFRVETSRPTADEVTDADLYYITPAQLAVDGKVEQRPIAKPTLVIEPEADGPDRLRL
jgi:hypothetical protein